jgi:hypothetical protein
VKGYSGPEAAGESCLSIVVAPDRAVRLLLELGWNLGNKPWRDANAGNELFDQLEANVRAESVGGSTIVNFPAVEWPLVGDEY